jgi:hypothetical protein
VNKKNYALLFFLLSFLAGSISFSNSIILNPKASKRTYDEKSSKTKKKELPKPVEEVKKAEDPKRLTGYALWLHFRPQDVTKNSFTYQVYGIDYDISDAADGSASLNFTVEAQYDWNQPKADNKSSMQEYSPGFYLTSKLNESHTFSYGVRGVLPANSDQYNAGLRFGVAADLIHIYKISDHKFLTLFEFGFNNYMYDTDAVGSQNLNDYKSYLLRTIWTWKFSDIIWARSNIRYIESLNIENASTKKLQLKPMLVWGITKGFLFLAGLTTQDLAGNSNKLFSTSNTSYQANLEWYF